MSVSDVMANEKEKRKTPYATMCNVVDRVRTRRIGGRRRRRRLRGEGWPTAAHLTPWRPSRRRHRDPGPPCPCCDRRRGGGDQRDPSVVAAGHGCISFLFRGRMATPARAFPPVSDVQGSEEPRARREPIPIRPWSLASKVISNVPVPKSSVNGE